MLKLVSVFSLFVCATTLIACGDGSNGGDGRVIKVSGAYATQIEEPWNSVVHGALLEAEADGEISYNWTAGIGYDNGAMEAALRRIIATENPDVIFGDAFGNEAAARRVAAENPSIAFAMGSANSEAAPNFSVFDNWIHEPSYLCGMLAGGLTKSNKIGVVGGYPVAEVNRLVNAFIAGARSVNPEVRPFVTYISSWYDPVAAGQATNSQIAAGADIFFGERDGVIQAAASQKLLSFGNIIDQQSLAPTEVVSSSVWQMRPTVDEVVGAVRAGTYTARNLAPFSMMEAGGAALAQINTGVSGGVPAGLRALVLAKRKAIEEGAYVVEIDESVPPGAVVQ